MEFFRPPDLLTSATARAYGVALASTTLILTLRLAFGFDADPDPALLLFFGPILLSAYLGGIGPGLVATVLAAAMANYFLIEPRESFSLPAGLNSAQWVGLLILGAAISVVSEFLHRSRDRATRDREWYATTLASLGEAVIAADARGAVSYMNPHAEALTGSTLKAARGTLVTSLLRVDGLEEVLSATLTQSGPAALIDGSAIVGADGSRTPVDGSVARVSTPDGAAGVVVVLRDRSDRDRAERLRAQVALQQRLALVATAAPGVICTFVRADDGSFSVPYLGPGATELLGIQPGAVAQDAKALLDLVDPDDIAPLLGSFGRAAAAASTWQHEFRLLHPHTGLRWISVSAVPQRDPDDVVRWHSFLNDVTDRRRSEDAVREQAALLQLSPDAIFVRDASSHEITFWGAGAQRLYGYSSEQALGRAPHELLRIAAGSELAPGVLLEGGHWEGEVTHRDANGREIVVLSRQALRRDQHGSAQSILEINTDITSRKRSELELERSRERFRTLVEAAPDIVLGVGADGRIEFAGAQVEHLGYQPGELVGQPVETLIPERLRHTHSGHRARFASAPTTRSMGVGLELFARRKDGSELPVEVSLGPARDGTTTVIVADVSARRVLEVSLRQAQKLEAVGQLAGGVAHDFNNLLTVISGYGSTALMDIGDGPGAADIVEVLRAADRASQLTGQLLAFSRQQVLRPTTLNLSVVARELVPMLTRLIGEDIRVVLLADDGVPAIVADRGQVEQVIMNLAVNARDAMPTGGTMTIEVQGRYLDGRSRGSLALEPGRYVCLTVTDTGGGVDPQIVNRLFEPFFTTKEVGRGTGLGLATVHGIATQSGGAVDVVSEPGLGATFHVYLPVATDSAAEQPVPDPARRSAAHGDETILVCEDEAAVRALVERVLRRHGYNVLIAEDPAAALRLASEHAVDLVVSDVVMPGMSGPELAERLRALHGPVRTLFMSGYTADAVRNRGRLPFGSAFLEKPFNAAALLQQVRQLLDASDEHAVSER